jgi:hypothetical protein
MKKFLVLVVLSVLALSIVWMPSMITAVGSSLATIRQPAPFLYGNSDQSYAVGTCTAGGICHGFAKLNSVRGYWGYTYVMTSGRNKSNIKVQWWLDGVKMREVYLGPGGSISDYVACDSLYILKSTSADTVFFGGYYNR